MPRRPMDQSILVRPIHLLALALMAATAGCGDQADMSTAPAPAPSLATASGSALTFRLVSVGYNHTCGVTTDDRAYCWGANGDGDLGIGAVGPTPSLTPVAVAGGHKFRLVSAGTFFTCGIATDDRAWCWGVNYAGQLGDGTTTTHTTPVAVVGPT